MEEDCANELHCGNRYNSLSIYIVVNSSFGGGLGKKQCPFDKGPLVRRVATYCHELDCSGGVLRC